MKQKLILGFLFGCLLFSFFLTGCGNKDNPTGNNSSDCGHQHDARKIYTKASLFAQFPYSYLADNKRTYILDYYMDSICTDVHINVRYQATLLTTSGSVFSFEAATKWQVLWEARDAGIVSYQDSTVFWNGATENVGLKQSFGENPADVFGNIYITFPTRGSAQLDSAFLVKNFVGAEIWFTFHYHKYDQASKIIDPGSYKNFAFANNTNDKIFLEQTQDKDWIVKH